MTRSVLLLTASAALLLLAAVLLWIGPDLGMEGLARQRHTGLIVEA